MKTILNYISFKYRNYKNRRLLKIINNKIKDGHYLLIEEIIMLDDKIGPGWWRMLKTIK